MQYDPIKRSLGNIFNRTPALRILFYRLLDLLLLRSWHIRRELRQMKADDEIRNILASRFDREMLTVLLQVDKVDLDEIVRQCNYSQNFIETANDLQILDAISECYEEYKVLSRSRSN